MKEEFTVTGYKSNFFDQKLTKINEPGQKNEFMNINDENKFDQKILLQHQKHETLNYLHLKFFGSLGKQTFICGRD